MLNLLKRFQKGKLIMIRVTVWNEVRHEVTNEKIKAIYPDGIHGAIAEFLGKEEDIEVKTVYLDMPDCGITDELLDNTDVLMWWGHMRHPDVPDELVAKINEYLESK
jgi:trehalose utilization protein